MPPWVLRRWWDGNKVICLAAFTSLFRYRFSGNPNVPRHGPVLLVSNHQSFLDPVLIGMAVPRYTRFVHRETLGKNKALAWLMASLRGIPIDHRGFSREGLQATLDALKAGDAVCMFAEGERTHDGGLAEFKPGFSLLVKKTDAPIVPVGIAGAFAAWPRTRKLPRPSPIAVSIGKPIPPSSYAGLPRDGMMQVLRAAVRVEMAKAERLKR